MVVTQVAAPRIALCAPLEHIRTIQVRHHVVRALEVIIQVWVHQIVLCATLDPIPTLMEVVHARNVGKGLYNLFQGPRHAICAHQEVMQIKKECQPVRTVRLGGVPQWRAPPFVFLAMVDLIVLMGLLIVFLVILEHSHSIPKAQIAQIAVLVNSQRLVVQIV